MRARIACGFALAALLFGAPGCDVLLGLNGDYAGPQPATSSTSSSGAGGAVPCEPPPAPVDESTGCPEGMVKVTASFCIDAFEVTFARYVAFVEAVRATGAGCFASAPLAHCTNDDPYNGHEAAFLEADPALPAHPLDYCDARAYCAGQGRRLCTNTQWLEACRAPRRPTDPGGYEAMYPWHDGEPAPTCQLDGIAPPSESTCRGSTPPRDGIFDMVGNVAEFTECGPNNCVAHGARRGVVDEAWPGEASCDHFTGAPLKDDVILDPESSQTPVPIPVDLRTGARCCWP